MRKIKLVLVLAVVGTGLLGVTAQAAAPVPSAIRTAVDKWTKTALQIQDSKISKAFGQIGAASAHAEVACGQPQARAALASVLETMGGLLEGYVRNTERDELGLYKLAPKLGSKQNVRRKAYVKLLDAVGTALDFELVDAKNIANSAAKVKSAACASALTGIGTDTSFLSQDHTRTDKALHALRAQFG